MDELDAIKRDLTRRSFLRGSGAAAGVGAASLLLPGRSLGAQPPRKITDDIVQGFDADVSAAMKTFGMVGASVALVEGNEIVYNRGFGTRDVRSGKPVTRRTRFRIGSNTKSMTSLMLARYVDNRRLRWNSRAAELWPKFRAPSKRLTSNLRVDDLLGMGSGVAEGETIEFIVSDGASSALDVLRSIPYLPVIGRPDTTYYYNNTLVAAAAHLASIAHGTELDALDDHYADELRRMVFDPIGMADAAVVADPRHLGPDSATGYTIDLFDTVKRTPFVSIDGYGPAGSAVASSTDMARYLITQMRKGVTPDGRRIASAANVARTHQPGIDVPPGALNALPGPFLEDTAEMNYCLGWFKQRFKDDRELLWHAGGIDGFGSLMGFFPRNQLGFVFLTNLEPASSGLFNFSIQSSLLSRLFGLNEYMIALLDSYVPILANTKTDLAKRTKSVDRSDVGPYLGLYSEGFQLKLDPQGDLRLQHDIRSFPILALDKGGYVTTGGPSAIAPKTIELKTARDGQRTMTIDGFEPVRWLTGD